MKSKHKKLIIYSSLILAAVAVAVSVPLSVQKCNTSKPVAPSFSLSYSKSSYDLTINSEVAENITPITIDAENNIISTVTYSLIKGTLPAGLTIDEESGVISGTPTALCTNKTVGITAHGNEEWAGKVSNEFTITFNVGNGIISASHLKIIGTELIGIDGRYTTDIGAKLVIPDYVTKISALAFADTGIKEVVIPASLTDIGNHAFFRCPIENITILPDNSVYALKRVGENGYAIGTIEPWNGSPVGCLIYGDLICGTDYDNPDTYTSIGRSQYRYCGGITSVLIRNTVIDMGQECLANCGALTAVAFDDDCVITWDKPFDECLNIHNVTIPDSLNISFSSDTIFKGCTLQNVTIKESNTHVKFLETGTNGHVLVEKSATWETANIRPILGIAYGDIVIPDTIAEINHNFSECAGITSLTFAEGITALGSSASFFGIGGLKTIVLPSTLGSLGTQQFGGYTDLIDVDLPSNLPYTKLQMGANGWVIVDGSDSQWTNTSVVESGLAAGDIEIPSGSEIASINSGAFAACSSIKSITMSDNITTINSNAFSGCYQLTSINLSENITEIPDDCFAMCLNLKEVIIPQNVVRIGESAFWHSGIITQIIPNKVEEIGEAVFIDSEINDIIFLNETCTFVGGTTFAKCMNIESCDLSGISIIGEQQELNGFFGQCTALKEVKLPRDMHIIAGNFFETCHNLEAIDGMENIVSIKNAAFQNCFSLEEIVLGDSLNEIGSNSFKGCNNLKTINLPSSLVEIEHYAFIDSGLEHIEFNIPLNFDFSQWDDDSFSNLTILNGTISNNGEYPVADLLRLLQESHGLNEGWTTI